MGEEFVITDHVIIFFPLVDWDAPWQRYQYLATEFSKSNRVVYVNVPAAITSVKGGTSALLTKWWNFFKGTVKVSPGLTVCSSPPCLPFERLSRLVNFINQYILFLYVKAIVKQDRKLILWISDPYKYLMIKWLRPEMAVYDCPDALVIQHSPRRQRLYDQLKKKLLNQSTLAFFTSRALLDEGRRYSGTCFYVPNGVDTVHFTRARGGVPDELKGLSGKILGVVGTFDGRIDVDLLAFLVESIKDSTLVLVGPIQTSMKGLTSHPRVILTGKRDYQEIPRYIRQFDVALIPYRVNEVTIAVYPVKLHEYLILGKPVVSTDLPEVRQFADVVYIAGSQAEFVRDVSKALEDNDWRKRRRRIEVAEENSWERRVRAISRRLHLCRSDLGIRA